MKKPFRSGFTILETIVATSIVVALAAVIFQLLVGGQMFSGTGEAKIEAQEWTRIVLERLTKELREASSDFVYIRNSVNQGGPTPFFPTKDGSTELNWSGDSIIFKRPCRESTSGAILLYNDPDDTAHELGAVVYGAQRLDDNWDEDYWIEYVVVEVAPAAEPPPPPPPAGIILSDILLPDACAQAVGQRMLKRRVWHNDNIDFTTLAIGPTLAKEETLSYSIDNITFRTDSRISPPRLQITVVGESWDSSRREEVSASVTSEIKFRN